MKLSVSTYSFNSFDHSTVEGFLKMCDEAKRIGFTGIEFTEFPDELKNEQAVKAIRDYCDKIGLDIAAYAVSADFLREDIDNELDELYKNLEVCKWLGCPVMRHDATFDLRGMTAPKAAEKMAPYIRIVAQKAVEMGIITCSENHGFVFQSPENMKMLIDLVDHSNYRWLCDIGNFLCVDADPLYSVKIAAPYTVHVHAKDFLICNDPVGCIETVNHNYIKGTVVGRGAVPVKECLELLKISGYEGFVTLEFEGEGDCLICIEEGFEFLKTAV